MKQIETRKIVALSVFTAIVVVLQFLGSFIHLGMFSISLTLIPIVVGAALYGALSGAWLGFVFGVVVLLSGDAAAFLVVNPLATALVVLLKGTLAGFAAGKVYRLVEKKNETLGVLSSAVVCPVVNTGIFLLGCSLFFMETLTEWATQLGFGGDVVRYMFLGLAGGNFLFELLFNLVLSPVVLRLIRVGKKSTGSKRN